MSLVSDTVQTDTVLALIEPSLNDLGYEMVRIRLHGDGRPVLQIMIDRMKSLKVTYIDVFLFSTAQNFGNAPCFLTTTGFLRKYFNERNFCYNSIRLFVTGPWYFMRYLLFPVYVRLYQLFFNLTQSKYKWIRFVAAILRKIKHFQS